MKSQAGLQPWFCFLLLLSTPLVCYTMPQQCWNCSSQCNRCLRQAVPVETIISEFYSGLFSATPPIDTAQHTTTQRSSSGAAENPYASSQNRAYGCCETEMVYEKRNSTTINGTVYTLVQLKGLFQFIPIGQCKIGLSCSGGECVQRYRAHWVLIYNTNTTISRPPLSFVPIHVKSHCECLNVGRQSAG